jgi:hypothetical protein
MSVDSNEAVKNTRENSLVSRCYLCGDIAIAIFEMPGGCIAYPNVKLQPLCPSHLVKATPLNGMYLKEDFGLEDWPELRQYIKSV